MSTINSLSGKMRCIVVLIVVLVIFEPVSAQVITTGNNSGSINSTGFVLRDPDAPGPAIGNASGQQSFIALSARGGWKLPDFSNINGSPFMHSEYNQGYVRVRSGFAAAGVFVKFNIYGNEIIFSRNGNEMALDSVDYVTYDAVGKNGTLETIRLKTGFPPIGSNTRNTIYQLLDSGSKVQLLKYYYKNISEVKSMGTAPVKEFATYQELYVHTTEGGIRKIKGDAESLKEAMPAFAAQIDKIVSEKKLKLKKEADLVLLIAELNAQKAF